MILTFEISNDHSVKCCISACAEPNKNKNNKNERFERKKPGFVVNSELFESVAVTIFKINSLTRHIYVGMHV